MFGALVRSPQTLTTRARADWVRVSIRHREWTAVQGDQPSHAQYTRAGSSFSSATASARLGWALWITQASVMWSRR